VCTRSHLGHAAVRAAQGLRAGLPRPRRSVLLGERQAPAPRHDHPPVQAARRAADLPEIDLHDVRHSYATAGRNAKIDWKAWSKRIGHADVAFTMKQYVQTDLDADREVANTLADLIIGGLLVTEVEGQGDGPG
jgi:integrase